MICIWYDVKCWYSIVENKRIFTFRLFFLFLSHICLHVLKVFYNSNVICFFSSWILLRIQEIYFFFVFILTASVFFYLCSFHNGFVCISDTQQQLTLTDVTKIMEKKFLSHLVKSIVTTEIREYILFGNTWSTISYWTIMKKTKSTTKKKQIFFSFWYSVVVLTS